MNLIYFYTEKNFFSLNLINQVNHRKRAIFALIRNYSLRAMTCVKKWKVKNIKN